VKELHALLIISLAGVRSELIIETLVSQAVPLIELSVVERMTVHARSVVHRMPSSAAPACVHLQCPRPG